MKLYEYYLFSPTHTMHHSSNDSNTPLVNQFQNDAIYSVSMLQHQLATPYFKYKAKLKKNCLSQSPVPISKWTRIRFPTNPAFLFYFLFNLSWPYKIIYDKVHSQFKSCFFHILVPFVLAVWCWEFLSDCVDHT